MRRKAELAGAAAILAACGGGQSSSTPIEGKNRPPSADVGELEIRANWVDRFTTLAAAGRLRFPPPASGSDTITIPATFTSRDGVRRASSSYDDVYTAASYVTIEAGRPMYHVCEEQARKELRPVQATGTFTLDVASD